MKTERSLVSVLLEQEKYIQKQINLAQTSLRHLNIKVGEELRPQIIEILNKKCMGRNATLTEIMNHFPEGYFGEGVMPPVGYIMDAIDYLRERGKLEVRGQIYFLTGEQTK